MLYSKIEYCGFRFGTQRRTACFYQSRFASNGHCVQVCAIFDVFPPSAGEMYTLTEVLPLWPD